MSNEEKYSIVFLDIDGILTTPIENWRDFNPECVKNLKYIIKETNCEIVIHSTWRNFPEQRKRFLYLWGRYGFNLETFLDFAPTGLRVVKDNVSNINDATYNSDIQFYASKREVIENWIENYKYRVESYCIIDDEDYNFDPKIFIQPKAYIGLSLEDAKNVIKILNNE